jgi:hypothetical protein
MVTPEEKKALYYYSLLARTQGVGRGGRMINYEVEEDEWNEGYQIDDAFSVFHYNRALPPSVITSVQSWYEREVEPKVEKFFFRSQNKYDYSRNYLEIDINLENGEMTAYCNSYFNGENPQGWEIDAEDDDSVKSILEDYKKRYPNLNSAYVNYNGGGDSGEIDGDLETPDYNETFPITQDLEDFIYRLLPGGWEINEGSRGTVHLDFKNNTINFDHTEYTEESERDTITEDNFLTNG